MLVKLKNMKLISVQVKLYLEQFSILNCHYPEEFQDFKNAINEKLNTVQDKSNDINLEDPVILNFTKKYVTFLSSNQLKSFVVCPDKNCFENIFNLIQSITKKTSEDTETYLFLKNLKSDYYTSTYSGEHNGYHDHFEI